MNHSIYTADRATHLKIVVFALVVSIAVAAFGIAARVNADDGYFQTAQVFKTKARLHDRLAFVLPMP
jgi:hypothetical protein